MLKDLTVDLNKYKKILNIVNTILLFSVSFKKLYFKNVDYKICKIQPSIV